MAITTSTDDLNIIAALDDEPNDVGGLSAAQLKAKFDEAVLDLQTYINTVLIPLLDAVNLPYQYGSAPSIKDQIDTIVAGGVSDGSITTAKLDDGAATFAKGGHGGTTAAGGVYNLINALSGITPVSADKFPFLDSSGSTAGSVTLANFLAALQTAGSPRIETGTYVGDGTYGSGNPNTLILGFEPQIVFVLPIVDGTVIRGGRLIMLRGSTAAINDVINGASVPSTTHDSSYVVLSVSWSGNTVSWYGNHSLGQNNAEDNSYCYVAIG